MFSRVVLVVCRVVPMFYLCCLVLFCVVLVLCVLHLRCTCYVCCTRVVLVLCGVGTRVVVSKARSHFRVAIEL